MVLAVGGATFISLSTFTTINLSLSASLSLAMSLFLFFFLYCIGLAERPKQQGWGGWVGGIIWGVACVAAD